MDALWPSERGGRAHLVIDSTQALLELVAQIIHLIPLQVQVSPAVSQDAFVAAGLALYLLQLAAPVLQAQAKSAGR